MSEGAHKEIYFHVGTGKTGTTFLQYRVFPKLKGIQYIQRTRYKQAVKLIQESKQERILLSREFDQQLENEVRTFASQVQNVAPIIVFRRHDSYIASQYRRFVKNGFSGNFQQFFDLKNDQGRFKKIDLDYCRQIQILKKYFGKDPIVLFYDDLMDDPKTFIEGFASRINAKISYAEVNTSRKHASYSEQQLKALMWVGKYLNIQKGRRFKNELLNLISRSYLSAVRYGTLYTAKLLPQSWFDPTPLISQEELAAVRDYYKEDWKKCRELPNPDQL